MHHQISFYFDTLRTFRVLIFRVFSTCKKRSECLPKTTHRHEDAKREKEREREEKKKKKTHSIKEEMATTRAASCFCCCSSSSSSSKSSSSTKKCFVVQAQRDHRPLPSRDHHFHFHFHRRRRRLQSFCDDDVNDDRYNSNRATRETTCSTSGGGVETTKKEKNENDLAFKTRHHQRTTKKGGGGAFASMMVASMLALHTSTSFDHQVALANATEKIAFEEETSSSQQQQEQQQQTPPPRAMMMAAAKPEEMKPELGQGFFKDLEILIEREPPIAVGFLFLFLINGVGGVIFTLFIRETNVGPGGEFGKVLAALRKEIIKEIFKFFGGALGRFTKEE